MRDGGAPGWPVAFALVYFTFFLDNVLLTVLVPIIPDWIRGSSLAAWTEHEAPLATLLNSTVRQAPGVGASQAVVGLVLSAKALAQLAAAGPAAAAVCRLGAPRVLRAATALLLLASTVFAACSGGSGGGAALAAGAARAAQGAGAAAAGVAGLTLASATAPSAHRDRAIGALLGAVALGVLVGYPLGGATYALGSRAAPFVIIAAALAINLALQYAFLDREEFNQMCMEDAAVGGGGGGWLSAARGEGAGSAGPCAGAVLLTTSVMAALEPCLPIWIMDKFHPQRWVTGAVFIPDSAAYLAATSLLGGAARALGAERVALAGQAAAASAALALPHARSLGGLVAPHVALGVGLGALDAALVPALLASAGARRAPHRAALLQAASAAAYALGPALGGALAWLAGFETALRTLGVANLLYAVYLYRALARDPLSTQVIPHWLADVANLLYAVYLYRALARDPLSTQMIPHWLADVANLLYAVNLYRALARDPLSTQVIPHWLADVANLLYAVYLYRALARDPLSTQWGARSPDREESSEALTPPRYHTFH